MSISLLWSISTGVEIIKMNENIEQKRDVQYNNI